ncbi:hypothetical protein [Radiobacillus sp. PE A8.2]|uniref:hypothetical protein n=1 Tax=Radiobacillus sp. PE A8.2 TaxID=3380349 RepID=UPI00388E0EC7
MKILLESLRFTFIFFILLTIVGVVNYLILSSIGINAENYGWIAIIYVFVILYFLYKHKGWSSVYNPKILWTSVGFIVLLSLLIPDLTPEHLHTTIYAYSFGFPFHIFTLYIDNGSNFLLSNIFSGGITGWNMSMGILGNFILFYFFFRFILLEFTNNAANEVR